MKILIVHGDDSQASRDFLNSSLRSSLKNGAKPVRLSKDSSFSVSELISSGNLFPQDSLYILEGPSSLTPREIGWLSENYKRLSGELILYSESQLSDGILKKLTAIASVKEFKPAKILYSFLDSFVPGKAGGCLKTLHLLLKKERPEFIFAVLGRHVRDLYWASVAPETLSYPSWRVSKLKTQAALIGPAKLKKVVKSMARIDLTAKSSNQDLASLLDLLIASQLE